ncbi:MAG: acyl carrier protein [Myxococcota bacterium]|jgi:acyl carrier protein|nr:acyl carrier protein [Myxococcota bacterium]
MGTPSESPEPVSLQVRRVICAELDVSLDEATPDKQLVADLGADSLDLVELMMALEESFDTVIPDEEAKEIKTVGEAIAYVEGLLARKAGPQP